MSTLPNTGMKFLQLKPAKIKGYKTLILYDADRTENKSFSIYRSSLLKKRRGLSPRTIDSYLRAVAFFLDYLHAFLLIDRSDFLTEDLISEAIDWWDEYLVEGINSDEKLIIELCKIRPSPKVSNNTSAIYHAGLKNFLIASEKLNRAYKSYYDNQLIDGSKVLSEQKLITTPTSTKMTVHQKAALISKSVIAGVIKGGPKLATPGYFPKITSGTEHRQYKEFPLDKIIPLIEAMTNDRDKALYAFLAASGARIHEALRILKSDIDIENRKVYLVNPNTRINDGDYNSFSSSERKEISIWKGRQTEETFLLEPLKSIFFKYAASYHNNEKPIHTNHEFFFCCIDIKNWGKPFLFATPSSIREGFNKAKKIVLDQIPNRFGPHSLRHSYGYYLLNFIPRLDGGYGLDLQIVQTIMGHADPNSTKRYAKHDTTIIEIEIAHANTLIFDIGEQKSIIEMQKRILLSKLDQVNSTIQLEKNKDLEAK